MNRPLGSSKTNQYSLSGKVVAITGGARGIGLATAKMFIAAGAVVAIGDVDAVEAERAAVTLGTDVLALPLDVTSAESFAAFLDEVERCKGPLGVLVNNAGVMLTGDFLTESESATSKMVEINLVGVIVGCRLAAARFAARGDGTIVNVASMAGVSGFPGVATYCATKFGVVGLTRALRDELRPHGVRVSAILPGIVHTELSSGMRLPGLVERFVSVEPEDIAAAVLAAVRRDRPQTYAPGRLRPMLEAMYGLPEGPRRMLARLSRTDRVYLAVDQATRDAYHARANP